MLVLILLAACSSAPQGNGPRASSTPSDSGEPSPSPMQQAKALLFPAGDGLWFYTVGAETARRIAGKEPGSWGWGFALRDATDATYFYKDALRSFDATKGTTGELFKAPGGFTMDWSPDGRRLAYMTVDFDKCSCATAYLYTPGENAHRIWTSKSWAGRGGTQLDEMSIAWSPDGTALLIVITALDTEVQGDKIVTADTIYVLRSDGSQVLKPQLGTMARWAPDGRSIYYRRLGPSGAWRVLTVAGGEQSALGLPSEAYRPRVSPDGTKIAFDDGKEHPSVFVFDIASGATQFIGRDFVAAVWLSAASLAAGKTTLCGDCEGPQWKPADASTRWQIDPPTAPNAEPMPIGSIGLGADVYLG